MAIDNRISLQKLEALCLVVRLGSVSRAAEKLYVTQPVVSAHLRSLQDRVGAPLLQRAGRGVELTDAGRVVYDWAEDLLRRCDDLSQDLEGLADGALGAVTVGASMSIGNYLLPHLLIQFRRDHPRARLTLVNSTPEMALDAVGSGQADFCVIAAFASANRDLFEAELIGKQRLVLVGASTDTSLPRAVDLTELRSLPFVCPPGGMAIRRSQDAALAALGVAHREVVIELGSAEAIKQAVQAHLGVALLWEGSVAADIDEGRLIEIEIDAPTMAESLYAVKLASKRFTPIQQKLYDVIRQDATQPAPGRALQAAS